MLQQYSCTAPEAHECFISQYKYGRLEVPVPAWNTSLMLIQCSTLPELFLTYQCQRRKKVNNEGQDNSEHGTVAAIPEIKHRQTIDLPSFQLRDA